MDKSIKHLAEFTRNKYGLTNYYLHKWFITRCMTDFNETVYQLSMEWFPNHIKNWENETCNPDGTACIEIDIHSKKIKSMILLEKFPMLTASSLI